MMINLEARRQEFEKIKNNINSVLNEVPAIMKQLFEKKYELTWKYFETLVKTSVDDYVDLNFFIKFTKDTCELVSQELTKIDLEISNIFLKQHLPNTNAYIDKIRDASFNNKVHLETVWFNLKLLLVNTNYDFTFAIIHHIASKKMLSMLND